jgi:hypothetical protein
MSEVRRCDGCGGSTEHLAIYRREGVVLGCYCSGCDLLRRLRGVAPGDHPQFRLPSYRPSRSEEVDR